MVIVPPLVGALLAGPRWPHLLLVSFWVLGYFAFFATTQWLKSRRKSRYVPAMVTWSAASGACGLPLALLRPDLLVWLPAFLPALIAGILLAARRHERALAGGIVTVVAACLTCPVAYDLGEGRDWRLAWTVTFVLAAYFVGTVCYVKSLIRQRDNPRMRWGSIGYHAVATMAMVPVAISYRAWWLIVLFAVLTARAAWMPTRHASPKTIGIGEIVASCAVAAAGVLLAAG